ncbi:biotin/acetyl-CoA-carboxylase ligase [Chloroherpeton thalassium ATCC 35110]|uniref:Biotin/acetyl-CoA-carboxylase ligase n=1 Tax=Chloroherpeton thalassium (strain ATCC 35110 / GB-78) TaxID=517418 RepID=B3QVP3_CHLT3|nr:biotin--[acetyl-CoA-carboxylase] ligase [Chloroherpeton thalassium]ACF13100.1 biotin/acetyl-CoA-carboxylase ligase [Chloroherpeton thalassium ATCC 35110]
MDTSIFLTAENIHSQLSSNQVIGKKVFCYHTASSTNEIGHKLARSGAFDGTLILAETQTRGKGRGEHVWLSNPGENLTFTIVLRPNCKPAQTTVLSLMGSLAIADAIYKMHNKKPEIKWPNDVLLGGKKVCGLLLESAISGEQADYVLLGIGLNVNQKVFPKEIESVATSLRLAANRAFSRAAVLSEVARHVEKRYLQFKANNSQSILEDWKAYCTMLGKKITFLHNGMERTGVAIDIDDYGYLRVRVGATALMLSHAEISNVRF